jgi:hypothetical protein
MQYGLAQFRKCKVYANYSVSFLYVCYDFKLPALILSERKPKMPQIEDFMYNSALEITGRKIQVNPKTFRFSDPMILSTTCQSLQSAKTP